MISFFEIAEAVAEILAAEQFIEYVDENDGPGLPELYKGAVTPLTMAFITIYAHAMNSKHEFVKSAEEAYDEMDEVGQQSFQNQVDEFDALLDYVWASVDYHVRSDFKLWTGEYILHGFDVYLDPEAEVEQFLEEDFAEFYGAPIPGHSTN